MPEFSNLASFFKSSSISNADNLLFALTAVLSVCYFKRVNIIMSIYLIAYGFWRIFIEFFRADDVGELVPGTISPSQWQSIVFILAGIALIVFYIIRKIPLVLPKEESSEKNEPTKKVKVKK